MKNQDIQTKIDTSDKLLSEARSFFETSDYDESERCANEVLELLEPFAERDDLGEERDTSSQKYTLVYRIAHAYNRLNTISLARSDFALALSYAEIGIKYSERIGDLGRKAGLLGNIGNVYSQLSDYAKALEYYQLSLSIYEEQGWKEGIAFNLGNIGGVYQNLSDYTKALEYMHKAFAIYEELGDKFGIARNLGNTGYVYAHLSDYTKALEYHQKSLAIHEELGRKLGIANNLDNIGFAYQNLSEYANALEYMQKALVIHEELGSKSGIAISLDNIGSTYSKPDFDGYDPAKAEEFLLKAVSIAEEIGRKQILYQFHKNLADLYKHEERWKECQTHFEKYHNLKEEVHSEESKKQANLMEQRKQEADREKTLAVERERSDATTKILHQVLPPSIADRLIKGEKIADYFTSISILFADIVGFTPIASKMPARKVLAFLNYVFGEFDRIIETHGCEKIKTIGDGYMAVAGAPIECSDHAEGIARASMEMMGDIQLPEDIRSSLPKGAKFSIRIGIHIGPAFGGIVGEKRFVYDIYSDTVNTAARMESHGEPGKIHVSEDFAFHLQNRMDMVGDDLGGLVFEEREEIEIKGKGKMKTYFLELK